MGPSNGASVCCGEAAPPHAVTSPLCARDSNSYMHTRTTLYLLTPQSFYLLSDSGLVLSWMSRVYLLAISMLITVSEPICSTLLPGSLSDTESMTGYIWGCGKFCPMRWSEAIWGSHSRRRLHSWVSAQLGAKATLRKPHVPCCFKSHSADQCRRDWPKMGIPKRLTSVNFVRPTPRCFQAALKHVCTEAVCLEPGARVSCPFSASDKPCRGLYNCASVPLLKPSERLRVSAWTACMSFTGAPMPTPMVPPGSFWLCRPTAVEGWDCRKGVAPVMALLGTGVSPSTSTLSAVLEASRTFAPILNESSMCCTVDPGIEVVGGAAAGVAPVDCTVCVHWAVLWMAVSVPCAAPTLSLIHI